MDTLAEQTANRGYFVTDAAGQKLEVCFEPLTEDDISALNGDDWRTARFGEVWKDLAEHEIALKLIRCHGGDSTILGIVQIGKVQNISGEAKSLRNSLLEVAPLFRFGATGRRYRGIGRVLVARLVVASKAQGAEGRLFISPIPTSLQFYRALGFMPAQTPRYWRLNTLEAEQLLTMCFAV